MKTDAQLQQDVIAELKWEPSINAVQIGVEVKDGIVTLAGHVSSDQLWTSPVNATSAPLTSTEILCESDVARRLHSFRSGFFETPTWAFARGGG